MPIRGRNDNILSNKQKDVDTTLNKLGKRFSGRRDKHLGYPYNLDFDPRPISQFHKFLNNLGDPYVGSHYATEVCDLVVKIQRLVPEANTTHAPFSTLPAEESEGEVVTHPVIRSTSHSASGIRLQICSRYELVRSAPSFQSRPGFRLSAGRER